MALRWIGAAAALGVVGITGEYALARYFQRRTLIRANAKTERTQKMAGTDWDVYIPQIREMKERLMKQPHEDVYLTSDDGLKLHGIFFPNGGAKRVALCCHGYTSECITDYVGMADFLHSQGIALLCIDERAHGKSEGTYIGFGCLDRLDVRKWIDLLIGRVGEDCRIMLYGVSMGGATVLMTTGLELPEQVKVAISDCAFTSAWEVFSSVLKTMYHLPAFPLMQISDRLNRKEAGYGLDECNARVEVKKSRIPTAFIHGEADTFVPCRMVYELYEACGAPKELLVVPGAAHAEAFYKDPDHYKETVQTWIDRYFR